MQYYPPIFFLRLIFDLYNITFPRATMTLCPRLNHPKFPEMQRTRFISHSPRVPLVLLELDGLTNMIGLESMWRKRGGLMVMCARLRSERSGFEPWPGTVCCVLGQDTLLSQCLSPPRCINGYLLFAGET